MGHTDVKTTMSIYTHLFSTDDHSDAMEALGAMAVTPNPEGANVIRLRG